MHTITSFLRDRAYLCSCLTIGTKLAADAFTTVSKCASPNLLNSFSDIALQGPALQLLSRLTRIPQEDLKACSNVLAALGALEYIAGISLTVKEYLDFSSTNKQTSSLNPTCIAAGLYALSIMCSATACMLTAKELRGRIHRV